jgi:hypothetical protein
MFPSCILVLFAEPCRSPSAVKRMLVKMVTSLFVLAKEQVYFPTEDEWKFCQTEHIENSFPGYFFFCIDGTVVEIWSPKDLKKWKGSTLSKSYFYNCNLDLKSVEHCKIIYCTSLEIK